MINNPGTSDTAAYSASEEGGVLTNPVAVDVFLASVQGREEGENTGGHQMSTGTCKGTKRECFLWSREG